MKVGEKLDMRDVGAALAIDIGCFGPFVGNTLRLLAGMSEEIDVDYSEPKDINDQLWIMGTIASFIPVATIITVKELIKQRRKRGGI